MSLPSPTFTFTIPSVHDNTILKGRLYLPRRHLQLGDGHAPKAAIIAHPYAPLGGSYDDPIVDNVGGVLLRAGYVIGTFNFRGAPGSAGHTSWSGKPELGDYVSFYGFMIYYLHGLISTNGLRSNDVEQRLSTVPSAIEGDGSFVKPNLFPRLILGGYSYGSMITSHLPNLERVVLLFKTAAKGSAEGEIQLRASHLSCQTLKDFETRQERKRERVGLTIPASCSNLGSSHSSSSVLIGGFESEAAEQRADRETRRSLDIRKSLDRVREKIHARPHRVPDTSNESDHDIEARPGNTIILPQICYLLISPVLPPVAALATLFSSLSFRGRQVEKHISNPDVDHELARWPCLAVYGSRDFFTSVKKLRMWAQNLSHLPGSNFRYREIAGAGHFWHETGVLEQMKHHIREWECSL